PTATSQSSEMEVPDDSASTSSARMRCACSISPSVWAKTYSLIKHCCATAQQKHNAFSSTCGESPPALAAVSSVKRDAVRQRSISMTQKSVDVRKQRKN